MNTPIYDFVRAYAASEVSRLHMPGHKGKNLLGCELYDITEIDGADVLSHADGIIAESQDNASKLFGTGATFYSTEGSSQCIKAMLAVVLHDYTCTSQSNKGVRPYILAARNVHRAMIDACALLDIDIKFMYAEASGSICENMVSARVVRNHLEQMEYMPIGVYLTSPDYLGNVADVSSISEVCDAYDVPLMVDNAHGAYLAFAEHRAHPIHLGAAICCDSAHKTLPALTGAAYLHISDRYADRYVKNVNKFMTLFGSTSPSYIIMQSLDLCNRYIADGYAERLATCIAKVDNIKNELRQLGVHILDTESLKIVIDAAASGYSGNDTADELRTFGIECEYADRQFVVLMVTPDNTDIDLNKIVNWGHNTKLVLNSRDSLKYNNVFGHMPERAMTIREAVFANSEDIRVEEALGRICATETIACPPAIPIAVSGEVINEEMIKLFKDYSIDEVCVVTDK